MRALLAVLALACLGCLSAEDDNAFPLGTANTITGEMGVDAPLGSGRPLTLAQAMTAAGWVSVNATSPSTSTSRGNGAWDPYNKVISLAQQRRQRPVVINGTTYQADLIEGARTNLLLFGTTENFERWTAGAGTPTITADTVASLSGETDADSFVEGAANGVQDVSQVITKAASSLAYAASVHVKNLSGTRKVVIELDDGTTTNGVSWIFDPVAGTAVSAPAAFGAGWAVNTAAGTSGFLIRDEGSGWYRISEVATSDTTTSVRMRVALYNGSTTSYAGNGTSGVYVWGASVEQATFSSSYISSRNCLAQTEVFDNATWTKTRSSVTANAVADPLTGNTTADKLVEDNTASSTHIVSQNFAKPTASTSVTFTVDGKAAERSWLLVACGATSALANGVGAYFDLTNGATGSSFTAGAGWTLSTKAITSPAAGWYRCRITVTTDATATCSCVIRLATADNTSSYSGDGTSGAYMWGVQAQYGANMTNYWPIASTKGLRSADIINCTMVPSTTTGTLLTIAQPRGWTTDIDGGTTVPFTLSSQPTSADAAISTGAALGVTQFRRLDAVNTTGATVTTNYTDLAWSQVAGTWDANTLNIYLSGVKGTAVTPTTPPYNAVTAFTLGGAGTNKFYGYVLALSADHVVPGSALALIPAGTTEP